MVELDGDVNAALGPYLELIDSYTSGGTTAGAFESEFVPRYLNDPTVWPREVFVLLDGLFAEADSYVEDPVVRAEVLGAISGDELLRYAVHVRSGLTALLTRGEQNP